MKEEQMTTRRPQQRCNPRTLPWPPGRARRTPFGNSTDSTPAPFRGLRYAHDDDLVPQLDVLRRRLNDQLLKHPLGHRPMPATHDFALIGYNVVRHSVTLICLVRPAYMSHILNTI
ncbi:uncharacterized protein SPSK_06756 [Sporothrix schenckii 1099-18]|uniref:Uncharacterized protein n=1 Tax=Sporothrix schenckii 1099-18 TaxID=1397361 RepID=A0A0F2MHV2_SPOSC|nr:uncharacterized protein SPSK_06756 [Sporothrix schenckii 1099-18]KJR89278.1 hypothetical protein SPSK_06756 [Sporothrix schenckii 1099-18]